MSEWSIVRWFVHEMPDAIRQEESDAARGVLLFMAIATFPLLVVADVMYIPLHWVFERIGRALR